MIRVTTKVSIPTNILKAVRMAIIRTIDQLSSLGQKVAKNEAPKDTGLLFNSLHLIREFQPPIFNGGIQTNVPYAIVMDEGRKPGSRFPPAEPITRWIIRHRASFDLPSGKARASALKSLTFLISRKIAKKGIKGTRFFKKAEKAVEDAIGPGLQALGISIQTSWDEGG